MMCPSVVMSLGEWRRHVKSRTGKEEQVAAGPKEFSLGMKVIWDCCIFKNKSILGEYVCSSAERLGTVTDIWSH